MSKAVQKLNELFDTTQPGSIVYRLSLLLVEDLRQLHKEILSGCDSSGVFSQVVTLITPAYRVMEHTSSLDPFGYTDVASILYIVRIVCALNLYIVLKVLEGTKSEDVENYVTGNRFNNLLLLDIAEPTVQISCKQFSCFSAHFLNEFLI